MVDKVVAADIQDQVTEGAAAARLINDEKRAINELIDRDNTFGNVVTRNVGLNPDEIPLNADFGSASKRDVGVSDTQIPSNSQLVESLNSRKAIVFPVDTIADLRSLEPLFDGQQIELLGHTVAGIGGGVFYADFSSSEADDNGTVIVTSGGRRWKRKLNGFVTPEMFGAIGDGVADDTSAAEVAIKSKIKIASDGEYRISNISVPVVNGDSYDITANFKNGTIAFEAALSGAVSASNVSRSDKTLTLASNPFSEGDVVVVSGTVGHENYTPSRYTSAKFMAKVESVSGLDITLDRQIDYILTTVTVAQAPLADVTVNSKLDSATISTKNIYSVSGKIRCVGDVGTDIGQSFFHIQSAGVVDIDISLDNAACVLGLVLNDVSSGCAKVKSVNSGGLSTSSTSKIFRANGICNMQIFEDHVSSRHRDHAVSGGRNCVFHVVSYGQDANFHESGSTTSNRSEAYANSECDGFKIYGDVKEANDQALEFLSCTNCDAYGHWENGKNTQSTEGAVVIKGASDNVIFHGTAIGHNSRGLKVECLNGATNCGTSPTAYVESDSTDAISVRDAASAYDTGHRFYGTVKPFNASGIDIRANSDDVFSDIVVDMENCTGYGIYCAAQKSSCNVKGVNTGINKRLLGFGSAVTSMSVGVINGDSDDVVVNYNSTSADYFEMSHANNMNGVIHFSGAVKFYKRGGIIYANDVPTQGIYSAGDFYHRLSYNSPAINETLFGVTMRQVEVGRVYNGSSWVQTFALRAT
jgi:hypothetical protein